MQRAARSYALVILLACGSVPAGYDSARAAENATNFYILGLKTTMAGVTPPPGIYLTDINYFYAGGARPVLGSLRDASSRSTLFR